MHGLAVNVKKGLSFAHDVSLQNSADSYVCFELALLNSVFYFFVLYRSPPSKLCTVSDSISSNKNEFLSINPSANVFVLETSTYNIRTDSPILVELIDLVNSVINFLFQMTLLRWLTFLLESLTVALSPAPLDLFLSLTLVFFLQWLPSIGKFRSYCCLSFHWLSNKVKTGCPVSSHSLWLSLCWLGWSPWSFERCSIRGYLQT